MPSPVLLPPLLIAAWIAAWVFLQARDARRVAEFWQGQEQQLAKRARWDAAAHEYTETWKLQMALRRHPAAMRLLSQLDVRGAEVRRADAPGDVSLQWFLDGRRIASMLFVKYQDGPVPVFFVNHRTGASRAIC